MMRLMVVAVLAWWGLASGLLAAPPNVVMIISDDQAWDDYGFMGHEVIQTPRLDRLASESLVFTRGYVPSSLCRPSLASMISGLQPHEHRIVGNDPPFPSELADLPRGRAMNDPRYHANRRAFIEHITRAPRLPAILGEELGYLSHQSGKWWEGHYSLGGFTHGMTHGDFARGGRHGDQGLAIGRQGLAPVAEFIGHAQEQNKPFFLWYAPFLPHTPHNPPERLLAKYRDKTPHLPVAKYWAMCEWFDETVGELLDLLETNGVADNTLVAYVCDNGWINDTQASRYAPRSKRSQYDGGIRTPIMLRWPGKIEPKMDRENLAISIDLAPTILAAVGLEPHERMTGINLTDAEAVAARRAIFGAIFEHDVVDLNDPAASLRHRWVIDDQWKLILAAERIDEAPRVELFHITRDPHEQTDLAGQHPERVEQLIEKLDGWWKPEE